MKQFRLSTVVLFPALGIFTIFTGITSNWIAAAAFFSVILGLFVEIVFIPFLFAHSTTTKVILQFAQSIDQPIDLLIA